MKGDLVAGITTAVMLIPQAMAYALLAGLPPIVGLYAALVPPAMYAIAGSSRYLAVGPAALDSLLTAATVGALAAAGSPRYFEMASLIAVLAGGFQLALGLFRGGFVVNFLSHPVVSGFTSAAALIIAASQLRLLLGLNLPRSTNVFEVALQVERHFANVHVPSFALGLGSLVLLAGLKKWRPRWPRALFVVALGSLATSTFGLDRSGVALVGSIPAGLPTPSWPALDLDTLKSVWSGALTIALVGFVESISVSTKLAERDGHHVDPNRELSALGLSNLAAGVCRGYPVAGGLARSVVNAEAGAKTRLAGLVTSVVVGVTLAFLTGLLKHVPLPALGAIIFLAVGTLIDVSEAQRLWWVKRSDFFMLAATFGATLTLGIQHGVLVGVGLSLANLIYRTTRPHTAVLGRLPGTRVYKNVNHHTDAITEPGILIVRLDAQLYFGNANYLRVRLDELEARELHPLRAVILDASGINQLDSTAEKTLRDLYDAHQRRGIRLLLAGAKRPVLSVLEKSGLLGDMGSDGRSHNVHEALSLLRATSNRSGNPCVSASHPPPTNTAGGDGCARTIGAPQNALDDAAR